MSDTRQTSTLKLPGIEDLGLPYDITGQYANTTALGTTPLFDFGFSPSGWDPDTASEVEIVQLYDGVSYAFPPGLYTVIPRQFADSQTTVTTDQKDKFFSQSLGIEGEARYGLFSASVDARMDRSYAESAYFATAESHNQVIAYRLAFQYPGRLREYLTEQAKADIDGAMTPDQLIDTYATHVMTAGVYGGIQSYTQSVSTLTAGSTMNAQATIEANYQGFGGAKTHGEVTQDDEASTSQSNGYFYATGGSPDTLMESQAAWAKSVANGNFALIAFNEHEMPMPISALASTEERRAAIDEAINEKVASATRLSTRTLLRWDASRQEVIDVGGDTHGIDITISVDDPHKVIVGFGTRISDKKLRACFVRTMDLRPGPNGEPVYGYLFTPDDTTSYDPHNYEMPLDLYADCELMGVAVTGVGLAASGSNVDVTRLTYQYLAPYQAGPGFLDSNLHSEQTSDKAPEKNYIPPTPTEGKVVTAISIGASKNGDNIDRLQVAVAPLVQYEAGN